MRERNILLNTFKFKPNLFFIALLLFVLSVPFSEAITSVSLGIILFLSLIFFFNNKRDISKQGFLQISLLSSIFILYLIGLIFTKDFTFGLYELKKVLFWLVIPFSIATFPKLKEKHFWFLLIAFSFAVLISTFFSIGKLIFHDPSQAIDMRHISFISHIRFSFQIILVLIILSFFLIRSPNLPIQIPKIVWVSMLLWLLAFLFIQKSILGIISCFGTSLVMIIWLMKRKKSLSLRLILLGTILLLIVTPSLYILKVCYNFYDIEKIDPTNVETHTIQGNSYHFNFDDKATENGHYVNVYICEKELRDEWNKRSSIKYDSIVNAYPINGAIIRYLTSKGLRKDAVGIKALTEQDVRNIEQGMANYIFEKQSFSIYPRIYETIWEIDNYLRTGNPNNQSLSQRIEFVKASLRLISKKPIFGIGTGNWKLDYARTYQEMDSKLSPENYGPSHNQYLNYMVKFGIAGFLWILFAVFYPLFKNGHRQNYIFIFFMVSMLLANFGDANWESHMGLSFFCFFYCLFLWHSPDELKNSLKIH